VPKDSSFGAIRVPDLKADACIGSVRLEKDLIVLSASRSYCTYFSPKSKRLSSSLRLFELCKMHQNNLHDGRGWLCYLRS